MAPHRRRPLGLLALLSWALLVAPHARSRAQTQTGTPTLEQLRADYAVRFLEPESHMALAKYHRDKGDPVLAFLILEAARRGLAAYLAVHRWKAASFETLRAMLREEAQLLRYDAISALIIEGGAEGQRVALEHRAREKHPRLKSMLDKTAGGNLNN